LQWGRVVRRASLFRNDGAWDVSFSARRKQNAGGAANATSCRFRPRTPAERNATVTSSTYSFGHLPRAIECAHPREAYGAIQSRRACPAPWGIAAGRQVRVELHQSESALSSTDQDFLPRTRIMSPSTSASTKSTWTNPPNVRPVTNPKTQIRSSAATAILSMGVPLR
jgi:hypothetical protein